MVQIRIRAAVGLVLAGALGVAAALVPAVAGSAETAPTVNAYNGPKLYEHSWQPSSVTIEAGGTVAIANPTAVPHGVHWLTGPGTPECSGVIVGSKESESGTNWSGSCKFAAAGTYTFDCTVHGPSMKGTIVVGTAAGTGAESTPTQTTPGQTGTSTTPGSTAVPLLEGTTGKALTLAGARHGARLRGKIDLAEASAGARLDVTVLVGRGSLGRHSGPANVKVGHLLMRNLYGGSTAFSLLLDTATRHALQKHGHLRVSVKMLVTGPSGASVTATRTLTLHA